MTFVDPSRVLDEFTRMRAADPDPTLEAVRTALVVEDVFGIALTDGDIDPAVLGDVAKLRSLVATGCSSQR